MTIFDSRKHIFDLIHKTIYRLNAVKRFPRMYGNNHASELFTMANLEILNDLCYSRLPLEDFVTEYSEYLYKRFPEERQHMPLHELFPEVTDKSYQSELENVVNHFISVSLHKSDFLSDEEKTGLFLLRGANT